MSASSCTLVRVGSFSSIICCKIEVVKDILKS